MENDSIYSNYSGCYPEAHVETGRPLLFFYLFLVIIAFPSNVFSLYVSWKHIRQGNEFGVYLFNLALTDLTFTVGLSLWMDFLWRGAWVHGGFVCMLSVNLLFTNFYSSDAFLCWIAVDRYLAVAHPLKFPLLRKIGTAVAASAVTWLLVVSFNAYTISWEDTYDDYTPVPMCFDVFPMSQRMAAVNVARFVLGFVVPLLLVLYCSRGICLAVKSNQATEKEERQRVSRLLTVVLLSVLLCFGPIHVMLLLRGFLEHCRTSEWLIYPYKISIAVSSLNCLVDPLLYCFITRAGKANVKQVVHFIQGKKRQDENHTTV